MPHQRHRVDGGHAGGEDEGGRWSKRRCDWPRVVRRKVIYMPATPGNLPTNEPAGTTRTQPRNGRTWFPILLGVLCGLIALCLLAEHEPPAFYRLTAWMFNEPRPCKLIEPCTVHFTLFMLSLAALGGSVGVLFSRWRKTTAFLFLLATLMVIAVFALQGNYLEPLWH